MDPKFNFTLPKNLGSSNQGLGTSNRTNLPNGINNSIANKVNARTTNNKLSFKKLLISLVIAKIKKTINIIFFWPFFWFQVY